MTLQLRQLGGDWICDDETGQQLGVGTSLDEALGNAVRGLWLSSDVVTVVEINSIE